MRIARGRLRFLPLLFFALTVSLLAQSNRLLGQSNAPTFVQEPHSVVSPNLSQPLFGAPGALVARSGRRTAKATAAASGSPPASQLNFAPAVVYGSGGYGADSVAVADVNGDGRADLVIANRCINTDYSHCTQGIVSVLLGNGDGTFNAAVSYDSGGPDPFSVVVADVNGDGRPDLILSNGCPQPSGCAPDSTVSVLLGNGDGTFRAAKSFDSGGLDAQAVVVADVNGDGKPDLVVADQCNSTDNCALDGVVGVLLGNGDGTFQNAVTYDAGGSSTFWLAVADVNGDSKPDVVVANSCGTSSCPSGNMGTVSILLGNGDGTFQTAVAYGSGGYQADSVAVADLNGDGKPDIVVANFCGSVSCANALSTLGVLLGNGDGTFQPAVIYDGGGESTMQVVVADVNGDGKPDVVVANQCTNNTSNCASGGVAVLLGNGDGTLQTAVQYDTGGVLADSVGVADVNRDGKADLMISNACEDNSCATTGSVGVLISSSSSAAATTTALVSSVNPSTFGQTVTFTATVTSPSGTPTGVVSFFDGTTNLGNPALSSSGVATLTTAPLTVGTNRMTATYSGDASFASSTSSVLNQVVLGPTVVFTPTSLTFGDQAVGTTSTPQSLMLTNTGTGALMVTSIAITGTNSADFAQTNNCGTTVSSGGNCNISVTFTPSALGARSAALSVTDNAPGSPQVATLTGTGIGPAVSLSPTSVTFPGQYVGTSGLPQNVTLTNTGAAPLAIASVIATPADFAPLSTCGSSVAVGASCSIGVFFDPTLSGTRTGTLTITDNASDSPQTVSLTGMGQDFSIAPSSSSSATVSAGQTASYTISVSPGGGFNQTVTFGCSGAPALSTCSVVPGTVTLGSSATQVVVSVATAASSDSAVRLVGSRGSSIAFWLAVSCLSGLVLVGDGLSGKQRCRMGQGLALVCLLFFGLVLCACGGSSGGGRGGLVPGTYHFIVTGTFTSGSTTLTHNTQLTLIVK